jgi:TRAP-type uncharacterized transport system substrate-binding protein
MATGPAGGAYEVAGGLYREILARHGIELDLLPTRGAADNLDLLRDPGSAVSVALVQGGIIPPDRVAGLSSLGTVFYEPVWAFHRGVVTGGRFRAGARISIGAPGSGTHVLTRELIPALGIDLTALERFEMDDPQAGEALLHGDLDLVILVSAWEAPVVRRLLADPAIDVLNWERADAHVALRPYLNKLVLPRGVADLARDRPPADVVLVATKTSLVVRDDLHPALQSVLLGAAEEIHGAAGIFQRAGQFPAPEPVDLPLSEDARQYYRSGTPFLQRHLPFWLAVFVGRLGVVLIPVAGVLYPVFRLLPILYGWGMRRRIFRLYGDLKFIEADLRSGGRDLPFDDLAERLDRLERRADQIRVPRTYQHMLYTLREHVGVVRTRLDRERTAGPGHPVG